jgi:hypothetical protein
MRFAASTAALILAARALMAQCPRDLDLRRFADSLLVPQRDGVATELARLEAVAR